jgi:hypothetical protein
MDYGNIEDPMRHSVASRLQGKDSNHLCNTGVTAIFCSISPHSVEGASMFGKIIESFGQAQNQQATSVRIINIYDAMLTHRSWKKRLHDYLDGISRENLDPGQVSIDHHCELGEWLHSDCKAHFGEQPVFIKLLEEHAKFHAHAAQVVEAHRGGNKDLALEILNGRFDEQVTRFVNCLTRFNAVVEAHNEGRQAA